MNTRKLLLSAVGLMVVVLGGGCDTKKTASTTTTAASTDTAVGFDALLLSAFQPVPDVVESKENPITPEKVELGRMLYFDARLSKNHDVSCNECHKLTQYGVDNEATSTGHMGRKGTRNSPTVYNAALHVTQFWDGRAPNVEEQAKGPMMNPGEMAMPNEAASSARSDPSRATWTCSDERSPKKATRSRWTTRRRRSARSSASC